jgi:ABC-type antimicrobial peptide transport system permease subunit
MAVSMSRWKLVLRSVLHHWRVNVAVMAGVAAATAVLSGALLVGDSVRGSLRDLALDRLGRIDEVLAAPNFFRPQLAAELAADPRCREHFAAVLPAIITQASLWHAQQHRLAGNVTLLGIEGDFTQLGPGGPSQPPPLDHIVLNEPLARELSAEVGEEVLVTLRRESQVHGESLFGRKTGYVRSRLLRVAEIVPAENLGRFGLRPNQQMPLVAFASLETLQTVLGEGPRRGPRGAILPGRVNALLALGRQPAGADPPPDAAGVLNQAIRPALDDYGLKLAPSPRGYLNLTTERMLLEDPVVRAAWRVVARPADGQAQGAGDGPTASPPGKEPTPPVMQLILDELPRHGVQPALTYLANYTSAGPGDVARIPYSTVTAVDFFEQPPLGPWMSPQGVRLPSPADGQIVLNAWAHADLARQMQLADALPRLVARLTRADPLASALLAEALVVRAETLPAGSEIRLTYFLPEGGGETTVALRLAGIVALDENSVAHDEDFTPEVQGVTDQESIRNWDAPFEYHADRIRPEDDDYWQQYRATPKAFVGMRQGQELWGTDRFGRLTSLRFGPSAAEDARELARRLRAEMPPGELGFRFQAVKRDALQAATGTTPFSVLFLMFSVFIIGAAAMLVLLLFRLGAESRADQIGLLLAAGFPRATVRRILAAEGLILAAAGSLVGTALGAAYAALMLYGLRTWWVDAVGTPFLRLHTSATSYVLGYVSGSAVSFAAIWRALRTMQGISVRNLLAGQASEERQPGQVRLGRSRTVAVVSLVLAVALAGYAAASGGEVQAGAFLGSGFFVLLAGIATAWTLLRSGSTGQLVRAGRAALLRLAVRNAARNPGRSTLTMGLMAAATFLIGSVSAFRIDPSQGPPQRHSGNGGFYLVAEAALPLYHDLNDPDALRSQYGFTEAQVQHLAQVRSYRFRVLAGEDASCKNLYQTSRPRVLGVPDEFLQRGGFAWAATAAQTDAARRNPWLLLDEDAGTTDSGEPYVPVVLDMNTAMYSLHLYTVGSTLSIEDDYGHRVPLRVVGMLANSIFQGVVLMSERNFVKHFPYASGWQYFLFEVPADRLAEEQQAEARLEALQQALQRGAGTSGGSEGAATLREQLSAARQATLGGLLEEHLHDFGFDTQRTGERIRGFLAVQNTYISTFLSLGGLGLLLGTLGLAAVQLRNVLERRGELALLRATGFRRGQLARLVLLENVVLLLGGLAMGCAAALVALLPHVAAGAATIPWTQLAFTLAAVLAVGTLAAALAARSTLRAPILAALRGS